MPEDYDGYVDYICGKTPGLDGVTYVDGSIDEPPSDDPNSGRS